MDKLWQVLEIDLLQAAKFRIYRDAIIPITVVKYADRWDFTKMGFCGSYENKNLWLKALCIQLERSDSKAQLKTHLGQAYLYPLVDTEIEGIYLVFVDPTTRVSTNQFTYEDPLPYCIGIALPTIHYCNVRIKQKAERLAKRLKNARAACHIREESLCADLKHRLHRTNISLSTYSTMRKR